MAPHRGDAQQDLPNAAITPAGTERRRGPDPQTAATVRVYLFGRMRVERDGGPVPDLGCTNARELLAYLLLHQDRPHRREAVANRLWGDGCPGDPKKTLRQALWRLNSVLEGHASVLEMSGDDWIRLSPGARIWVDVAAFESAWREVEGFATRPLPESAWSSARAALDLYRGELLDGIAWPWCVFERERLRDVYLAMGDAVMERCLTTNDVAEGIRLGFDILRHDPARETTHRRLMRFQALRGDRSTALRQYHRCAAALKHELGVEPSQTTRELFDQIRDDRLPLAHLAERSGSDEATAILLERLSKFRQVLSQARHEVHLEIEAIEKVVQGGSEARAAQDETRPGTHQRQRRDDRGV